MIKRYAAFTRKRAAACIFVMVVSTSPMCSALSTAKGGLTAAAAFCSPKAKMMMRGPRSASSTTTRFLSCSSSDSSDSSSELYHARYQQLQESSKLALAPMMDYTDRHFRHLVRLLSNRTLLYTEMVTANTLVHERRRQKQQSQIKNVDEEDHDPMYLARFLAQSVNEGSSVLQLGGSNPDVLYEAVQTVLEQQQQLHQASSSSSFVSVDYTGLNLNCGCPSPKVSGKGCFGAALMSDPHLVRCLTTAMYEGGNRRYPVSVKCRIGTDHGFNNNNQEANGRYDFGDVEYQHLCRFIDTVASDGIVKDFSIHARIAVLSKSFSPAANRKIPPLNYDVVRRLVKDFPSLRFTINGGVTSLPDVQQHLQACPDLAGVMVGRAWAADPWSFSMVDTALYNQPLPPPIMNRWQILQQFGKHADREEATWDPVKIRRFILRAISPLFTGEPNAKKYRIALDDIANRLKRTSSAITESAEPPLSELILDAAQRHLSQETLLRTPQESYDLRMWEKQGRESREVHYISQWQQERKMMNHETSNVQSLPNSAYNQTLSQGLVET